MPKNIHPPSALNDVSPVGSGHTSRTGLSCDAVARRRMLLKSLGKGSSVIAAAAIPMHTLAATGTLAKAANGKRCTVSSMASGVHSKETTTEECSGRGTSNYQNPSAWPNATLNPKKKNKGEGEEDSYTVTSSGIPSFSDASSYYSVFACGSDEKLRDIVKNKSSSVEAIWITALLNSIAGTSAITQSGVKNYPYTPAAVIAMCKAKPAAVAFFRDNLQNS